jgi:hypothetical protein
MNYKKIITTVAFALGALMSLGVMAQSVSYLGNDIYAYNDGSPNSTNMNFSVTISNTNGFDAQLQNTPWWANEPMAKLFSAAAVDNATGANFAYSSLYYPPVDPDFQEINLVNIYYYGYYGNNDASGINPYAVATQVSSTGAPEIDGSLAPKVGFLLGCLFLMFGRKKQNTEPMMTA